MFSSHVFTTVLLLCTTVYSSEIYNKTTATGRDFGHHFTNEEEKQYPTLTYPPTSSYYYRDGPQEGCAPSPLIPMLNGGLNFILLKLGALAVVKAIIAVIFVAFLIKLPILLGKLVLLKSIVLPLIIAPLMLLSSHILQPSDQKPSDSMDAPSGGNGGSGGEGRSLSQTAMESLRFVLNSDKCMERFACQLGSDNKDGFGQTVGRLLKYAEHSAPTSMRRKLGSAREAYKRGFQEGICLDEIYPCNSPKLLLSQGSTSLTLM